MHIAIGDFERRVITARNWITAMRDQDGLIYGGRGIPNVKGYYKHNFNRDFPVLNRHIADVEHFYTSAMISSISGAFYIHFQALAASYELLLQPLVVMFKHASLMQGWNNLKNNWRQLSGPNKDGAMFAMLGKEFARVDIQQFFNVDPVELPPSTRRPDPPKPSSAPRAAPKPTKTIQLKPGQSLSALSKQLYGTFEYWPLLWDLNPQAVRNGNPNRTIPGAIVKYLPLTAYKPAQLADAKKRFPTWKNYPH